MGTTSRSSGRIGFIAIALLICLLFIPLTITPALAAEIQSGDVVTIAQGQTIDDDLYVSGGTITIDGTVNGDLLAAGGIITVNGTINGNVNAAGGNMVIGGQVERTVRCLGGTVQISGQVGRDVVVAGGDVTIQSGANVGGDLLSGSGSGNVAGTVNRLVRGSYGQLIVAGTVGGGIDVEVDQLIINSGATVQGDVTYRSENQATIEPGAQITGQVNQLPPTGQELMRQARPLISAVDALFRFLGFLMALIAGIVFILLVPRVATVIADSIHDWPLPTLGWGALLLFGTPVVILLLLLIVVGIPIALALLALYVAALWFSSVIVALFLGEWIINRFRSIHGRLGMILALLLGLVIVSILTALPFIGWLVSFVVILFGLGAIWVGLQRWLAGERPPTVG